MTTRLFEEVWDADLKKDSHRIIFIGDSPNDAPMFSAFPHAVGVQNVADFRDALTDVPAWITQQRGGAGFAELAQALVESRP